jgi:AraC-like DNA-binding protein
MEGAIDKKFIDKQRDSSLAIDSMEVSLKEEPTTIYAPEHNSYQTKKKKLTSYSILYLKRGCITVSMAGHRKIECNVGSFIIIPPGNEVTFKGADFQHTDVKQCSINSTLVHQYLNVSANRRSTKEILHLLHTCVPIKANESEFGRSLSALIDQCESLHEFKSNSIMICGESITQGLVNYITHEYDLVARIPSRRFITKVELYVKIRKANEFINENITNEISVDLIAEEIGMSKFHFIRCFAAVYKMSPHKYLLEKRLLKSLRWVEEGHLGMLEISSRLQFTDSSYFSNQFKQRFGCTPSHVRTRETTTNPLITTSIL